MDKNKFIKGLILVSLAIGTILLDATILFIGFNNMHHNSYTFLIIGLVMLPFVFYFIYKGLQFILDAIFKE